MSRSLRAHLLLIAVVFVWGATFVVIKDALQDISPLLFNLIRMTLAFACLAVVYRAHWKNLPPRAIASGAIVGLCLAMGYQFQTAGLQLTTPSKSAFITGLLVVLVPLLSAIPFLRPAGSHAPRWNAYLGAFFAFAGIVLLTTPAHASFGFDSINLGDILTLGCALGFALHVLALAHTLPRVPFTQLALLQIGFCALFMAISGPLLEHPYIHWTPRVIIALSVAALLATAAAFTVQSYAQQYLPPTHTALILALEPVFAWLTSFVVLRERLGLRASCGALLILCGIAFTEFLPGRIQPTAHETVPGIERT
ncbi:MAG TPA: DMT family transporter [Pseudacidobacterium sp.]|jgi:drug/metabolite transporter (DMT)-like permease|nr:DMT family transporter [Pseudacidobacterium sp.]